MACRGIDMRIITLLLLLVASLAVVSRSARVGDFPLSRRCGETTVDKLCVPSQASANQRCTAACHDSGCGAGGKCINLGYGGIISAWGCHCLPVP